MVTLLQIKLTERSNSLGTAKNAKSARRMLDPKVKLRDDESLA
jgi:hypothetical protein